MSPPAAGRPALVQTDSVKVELLYHPGPFGVGNLEV